MRRQWLAVGVSLTCALAIGAAQQAPRPPSGDTPSFRSGISYVELDASVLDGERNPVRGLAASDFTVLEDGKPQKILSFSEVNVPDPVPPPVAWMRDVAPDVQANDEVMNRRLVVILLDDGQSPVGRPETNRTKEVAKMIVDRLGPGDLAAVYYTRLQNGNQAFTSDHIKLQVAIDKFVPFRDKVNPADIEYNDAMLMNSIDHLETMATNLAALPGRRKTLFYFGVSPFMPDPNFPNEHPRSVQDLLFKRLMQMFRDAQNANLNIYPINPGGLTGPDDYGVTKEFPEPGPPPPTERRPPDMKASEFFHTVADNTGGVAVVDLNGFEPVMARALRENGSYYLLGYESPNPKADGKLRTINVKVNRSGVTVRARSGYYGATSGTPAKAAAVPNALSPDLASTLSAVVQNPAIKMQVSAAAFAIREKPGAAVAITLGMRPDPLADRTQVDDVNLVVAAVTPDGSLAASWQQPARIGGGLTQYELLTRLDVKPGRYQLRVSAESKRRGKAGSVFTDIDVPDFSKPLSLSGVVVHATPGLAAPPNAAVAELLPLMPTTQRDFSSNQQVTAFLRIYQGGDGPLMGVPVSVRVRDAHDAVVFEAQQTVDADRFGTTRAADYRLALPMDQVTPGPYLLTVGATLGKETVRRDVRFQVLPNAAKPALSTNGRPAPATPSRDPAQLALDGVLARMTTYLAAYAEQYSSTIATESYKQSYGGSGRASYSQRLLDAEFGIVRLPGASQWLGFRDVTRVDGKAIEDHEGRLAKLFQGPASDTIRQADKITEESTRYNVGPILRTMNNPAIVLEALDARNQFRFTFMKGGEEVINGVRVWMLRFTEQARPTFITTFPGDDEPLVGRAWVDPATGRVVRAELAIQATGLSSPFRATINVTFREEPRLRLWVPATMTERYESNDNLTVVASGDATYSDYRRFGVETREELAK